MRPPDSRQTVHVYYMIALQTTDVLMATLAREKGEMLETLLTKGTNEKLRSLLEGNDSNEVHPEVSDGEDEIPAKGKKTRASRLAKTIGKNTTIKGKASTTSKRNVQATSEDEISADEKVTEPAVATQRAVQSPTEKADQPKGKGKAANQWAVQSPTGKAAKSKGKAKVKSKEFVESSGEEASTQRAAQSPAQEVAEPAKRGRGKASGPQLGASLKGRTQQRAAARDTKWNASGEDGDLGEQPHKVSLAPRATSSDDSSENPSENPSDESSEEDSARPAAGGSGSGDTHPVSPTAPRHSQQPAVDDVSMEDDTDDSNSISPPPCGQPKNGAAVLPTGTQTTTGATQGSSDVTMSGWEDTLQLDIRTPRNIDIRDGTVWPPFSPLAASTQLVDDSMIEDDPPAQSINEDDSISMFESDGEDTPPRNLSRKHMRSPNERSPQKERRPRKRQAAEESDGEDFSAQMADVRGSSPTPNHYDLATRATSQPNETVPSLAFKPIVSKKVAMRGKAGSSKGGSSRSSKGGSSRASGSTRA